MMMGEVGQCGPRRVWTQLVLFYFVVVLVVCVFYIRARLVDRVRPTVPLSYSTGCVKYDDEFPG